MNEGQHSGDRENLSGSLQPRNPNVAYEPRDLNLQAIFKFALALVVFTIVGYFYLWGLLKYFQANSAGRELRPPALAAERQRLPPEPRLQGAPGHEESPATDLQKLRQQEDRQLHSYGWVDRKNGIVRIPVEDAKKLLLKSGLPTRERKSTAAPAGQRSSSKAPEEIRQQISGEKTVATSLSDNP